MQKREVEIIPATKTLQGKKRFSPERIVAAYARVSTHKTEQENSLEAQVAYFDYYIRTHKSWTLYKVYIDEGITGTKKEARKAFMQMINDALEGKFDLILTKSISRFARNTVDTLNTIRKLKDKGVEVFFEKENISTFDSKGEFILTLMGSFAQEESRSISENIIWGLRRYYAKGNYSFPVKNFLGYDKTSDNKYIIVKKEAAIVKYIFFLFLLGDTPYAITKQLIELKIPTPMHKTKWGAKVVESILSNEKYKGDALTQKTFTVDFLTGKMKKNEGELPQYYITDAHPAIINRKTFDYVQERLCIQKQRFGNRNATNAPLTTIVCAKCGFRFGIKIAHSNDKYRRRFWRCNGYYLNQCHAPTIHEDELEIGVKEALQKWALKDYSIKVLQDMKEIVTEEVYLQLLELIRGTGSLAIDNESIRILIKEVEVSEGKQIKLILLNDSIENYQL